MIRHPTHSGRRRGWVLALMVSVGIAGGCVRRTLTIQTEPAGALIFLNDEEIGRSPVTTDFTWYGDYDLIIRQPGYDTLKTHVEVRRPWYQVLPIDFVAEVLWPQHLVDAHTFDFSLTPAQPTDRASLIERAQALRERTLHQGE